MKNTLVRALFALAAALALVACADTMPPVSPTAVVVSAAEIVNEVARRGDEVYAVTVAQCDAAERSAAELPDVQQARAAVAEIRGLCDEAFARAEQLRVLLQEVDDLLVRVEGGAATVHELVEAALRARSVYEETRDVVQRLRGQLGRVNVQ